jgi:solute carrier family 25 uncoupling protein 27
MPQKADLPFIYNFGLSAAAATVAETVTFPLDISKTRMQIQGQKELMGDGSGSNLQKRGLIRTAHGIVSEEGFVALYRGLPAAAARHVIYTGARMGIYEHLREWTRGTDGRVSLGMTLASAMTSGAISQFLASPADLVKVKMQLQGRRVLLGHKALYTGSVHCFCELLREPSGVLGMWRGWLPNVQRAALVNLGELAAYDTAKQTILRNTQLQDNMVTHTLASFCSGIVAATCGTPADVIKSRIMGQQPGALQYSGVVDCLVQTVQGEGVWALWKGFGPNWARMAPWSLTFWLSYEQLRKGLGLKSF